MAALPSFISGSSFGTSQRESRKKLRETQLERIRASRAFKEKTATTKAGRATELEAQRQRGAVSLAETRGTVTERLAEKGILGEIRTAQEARPFKTGIAEMQYGESSGLPAHRRAAGTALEEEAELGKKKVKLKGRELDILGERLGLEKDYLKYLLESQPKTDTEEASSEDALRKRIAEISNIYYTGK